MEGPLLKAQPTQPSPVVFMPGMWGVRLMAGCIPPCRYGNLNIVLWRSSMRRLLIAFSLLALCGLASAQVTVISGYASNWAPGYSIYQTPGAYAAPFVPLVTTPSVSIETGMPTQIGASNATTGNVAGATNSTISLVAPNIVAPNMSASPVVRAAPGTELGQQNGAGTQSVTPPTNDRLELGAASFQASRGAAQLIASRQQQKPARTITNDDIDRLNQQNGTVQFKGKTEKIE